MTTNRNYIMLHVSTVVLKVKANQTTNSHKTSSGIKHLTKHVRSVIEFITIKLPFCQRKYQVCMRNSRNVASTSTIHEYTKEIDWVTRQRFMFSDHPTRQKTCMK